MNKIKLFFIYHFRKEGNTRKYTIISFIFLLLLIAILTLRSFVNTHTFLLCVITVVLSIFAIFSEIKKIFNENSLSFLLKNNLITLLGSSFCLLLLFTGAYSAQPLRRWYPRLWREYCALFMRLKNTAFCIWRERILQRILRWCESTLESVFPWHFSFP